MLHTPVPDPGAIEPVRGQSLQDYDRVRRIIAFLTERSSRQPSLDDVAAHVGLSASHVHALFRRWAGITPKEFLAAVTLDRAKSLLADHASLLDAAYETGLSGPSRLHDLFVTHEAMSPGDWKRGAEGVVMRYGFHPSPFGEALAVITERGLAGLGWVDAKDGPGRAATDGKPAGGRAGALADMARRWPNADFVADQDATAPYVARAFDPKEWRADRPLRIVLIGSDFEVRVWETLIGIPMGRATTYSGVAAKLGRPGAARAVGAAVGRNPLSFVVPCHRVLGKSGALTGYHWGVTRKQAILGWEAARAA
ncbi:MAG: bifunctional helix-turn-helix domain-containing protein/methylated-DNA--[protein]-cysteine S-methyltransferase [Rhizobiales bacterium]|nr:bifunctional helix-turn-helix domain-containing protein/methylated-DNA--[protein]-cysteine S-methyltransferase [Hyphomicrobiales bacterium]